MLEKGIIDPAKVVRSALENAASIAAMILTTEALITDMPEKGNPTPHAADAGILYSSQASIVRQDFARVYRPLQGFLLLAKGLAKSRKTR